MKGNTLCNVLNIFTPRYLNKLISKSLQQFLLFIQILMTTSKTQINHRTFTLVSSAGQSKNSSLIQIEERFFITSIKNKGHHYNTYEGVDIKTKKFVKIYLKTIHNKFGFSGKIKEEVNNILAPKILWKGFVTLNESVFQGEVHESSGPSLRKVSETIKDPITSKQLLHLLYQMLKLLERLSNHKYVCTELSPENIHLDANPSKTQLFLQNCFHLRHKGQKRKYLNTKFCSLGSHLGRNAHIKDDLESAIYILMDLYAPNTFLEGVHPEKYQEKKSALSLQDFPCKFPEPFILFYCDVLQLNFEQDFNFVYWKTYLSKVLNHSVIGKPYHWKCHKQQNYDQKNLQIELASQEKFASIQRTLLDLDFHSFDCQELEEHPSSEGSNEEERRQIMAKIRIQKATKY